MSRPFLAAVLVGAALLWGGEALFAQQPAPYLPPVPAPAAEVPPAPPPEVLGSLRLWGEADFLMWWLKDRRLPPLVTTSASQASLGVLGQPDTRVLFGGSVDGDLRYGGRFTLGTDLTVADYLSPVHYGAEAVYFFLGDHTNHFHAISTGNPLLARPLVDTATGQPFSHLIANMQTGPVRASIGSVAVSNPSRVWGAELNGTFGGPALRRDGTGFSLQGLVGFRHLGLEEDLCVGENQAVPAAGALPATAITTTDEFRTRNYFYGPQMGFKSGARYGAWTLDLTSKLALGWIDQTVEVRGSTVTAVRDPVTGQFLAPTTRPGGLLAQPGRLGKFGRTVFCAVPEVTVNLGYDITSGVRAFVGYNFLYVSDVVRPGDVVDARVRPGGAAPAFAFRGSDLWIQGLLLGLDVRY